MQACAGILSIPMILLQAENSVGFNLSGMPVEAVLRVMVGLIGVFWLIHEALLDWVCVV